ncbi:MAG: pyridoxamine 5'-phosphate oxidase, partial [Halobacteria archaeon]|nr:pyridoxamine 5'-phosphate oxidase [Halobacteria archaeon]
FWQARTNRLHDRFIYTRDEDEGDWRIERLAP